MTNIKQCQRCKKSYPHEGIFRNKMKYPLRNWCMDCINAFMVKPDDDEEVKYIRESKQSFFNNINWNNEKTIIVAILVIIIVFALLISLKRDYGKRDYYPEERPLDIDYQSIF